MIQPRSQEIFLTDLETTYIANVKTLLDLEVIYCYNGSTKQGNAYNELIRFQTTDDRKS